MLINEMRDLITLIESVGLANRKPGDRFANPQGHEMIFTDLKFFPDSGSYNSAQEMANAIDQVAQQIGVPASTIAWINQPKNYLAFGLAHFVDDSNKDYYIGRYYNTIDPNRTQNKFPNDLPGGYKLQTRAAKKEATRYKPADVLVRKDNLTPQDIQQQINQFFGADSDEARATEIFMTGNFPMTIPQGNINYEAFTNYFCEMLQPMALVMGKKLKGNYLEAGNKFLSRGGFATCRINFSEDKNEGLTDSRLINAAGQEIGISSKAEKGAAAAVKNLLDKVDSMEETDDGRKLLAKYASTVAILRMVKSSGQLNAPLDLAVSQKLITPEEKQQVLGLKGLRSDQISGRLSPNLEKMYRERGSKDPSRIVPLFHMVAAIAHLAADYVNTKTDFGKAAATILNHGAFMQAYTESRLANGNIILDSFVVKWPSEAVTDVLFRAAKTYYSTDIKGNYTFEILRNGAKAVADTQDQSAPVAVDTKPDVDLSKLSPQDRPYGRKRKT
jgi:hypothetical protein